LFAGLREIGTWLLQTWGSVHPRTGWTTQAEESKAAAINAQRAGDIVKAGYNINMNRPITAACPVPPASATRLSEVWNTPSDARDWIVDVVGENIVTTCDAYREDSIPGTGLLPNAPGGLTKADITIATQCKVAGFIPSIVTERSTCVISLGFVYPANRVGVFPRGTHRIAVCSPG
jgi:hypothetical protein